MAMKDLDYEIASDDEIRAEADRWFWETQKMLEAEK